MDERLVLVERPGNEALTRVGRAGPAGKARAFILPTMWAVLALRLAYCGRPVAATQVADTSGQSYYANARTLLDDPLPNLLLALPELRGLEPA